MKRSESGEIATLLAIGAMIIVAVSAITSSFFVNQKQSTSSRATGTFTACEYTQTECDADATSSTQTTCIPGTCTKCTGSNYKCEIKSAVVPSATSSVPKPTATIAPPTGGVGSGGKYSTSDPGYDPVGCKAKGYNQPESVFNCCTKKGIFTGCYMSPCNGSIINPGKDTNQYWGCAGLPVPTIAPTGPNGKPMVNGEINGCCFLFHKNSECGGGPMLAYWGDGIQCIPSSGLGTVDYAGPCSGAPGGLGIGLTIGQKLCTANVPTITPAVPPTAIPATPAVPGAPTSIPPAPAGYVNKTVSGTNYLCEDTPKGVDGKTSCSAGYTTEVPIGSKTWCCKSLGAVPTVAVPTSGAGGNAGESPQWGTPTTGGIGTYYPSCKNNTNTSSSVSCSNPYTIKIVSNGTPSKYYCCKPLSGGGSVTPSVGAGTPPIVPTPTTVTVAGWPAGTSKQVPTTQYTCTNQANTSSTIKCTAPPYTEKVYDLNNKYYCCIPGGGGGVVDCKNSTLYADRDCTSGCSGSHGGGGNGNKYYFGRGNLNPGNYYKDDCSLLGNNIGDSIAFSKALESYCQCGVVFPTAIPAPVIQTTDLVIMNNCPIEMMVNGKEYVAGHFANVPVRIPEDLSMSITVMSGNRPQVTTGTAQQFADHNMCDLAGSSQDCYVSIEGNDCI